MPSSLTLYRRCSSLSLPTAWSLACSRPSLSPRQHLQPRVTRHPIRCRPKALPSLAGGISQIRPLEFQPFAPPVERQRSTAWTDGSSINRGQIIQIRRRAA